MKRDNPQATFNENPTPENIPQQTLQDNTEDLFEDVDFLEWAGKIEKILMRMESMKRSAESVNGLRMIAFTEVSKGAFSHLLPELISL